MKQEDLIMYATIKEDEGITTLFRKFDDHVFIFQFNNDGKQIGQVCLDRDTVGRIYFAPTINTGDGTTKQIL